MGPAGLKNWAAKNLWEVRVKSAPQHCDPEVQVSVQSNILSSLRIIFISEKEAKYGPFPIHRRQRKQGPCL